MSKVRVSAFTISLDGFGAGVEQDLEHPMGHRGEQLHKWMHNTRMFQKMIGNSGGSTDVDNKFAEQSMEGIGAWIMGRNMFGPIRGPWPDETWQGWWGEEPPYHTPVYVLTHHERKPLTMKGGTTFYFEKNGIEAALKKAKENAQGKDIRIGGGVGVIRQYLKAGLIDEMHLAYSPVLLGKGEAVFAGIDLASAGFKVVDYVPTANATHVVLRR